MPALYTVQQLSKITGDFVAKRHGTWNHEEWEQLCLDVSKLGINLNEEMQAHLGLLIETLKVFYTSAPKRVKSAPTKRKTGAKHKAKRVAKLAAPAGTEPLDQA